MDWTESEGGKGIILVVDDQPLILKLVRVILESIGLEILSAEQPLQAVRLAEEHRDRIRLLITDVHLCGMDGEALAGQVLKHCPGLHVLYMSGDRSEDFHFAAAVRHEFIGKPFTPAELTRRVEALLAGATVASDRPLAQPASRAR